MSGSCNHAWASVRRAAAATMKRSMLASSSATRRRWTERLVAMVFVALSLKLVVPGGFHREGLWVQQLVLWPAVLVLVVRMAWRDRQTVWARLCAAPLLVTLVGWSAASVAWSIDPTLSAVRAIGLLGTVLGAVWMVARFDRVEVAYMVAVPLTVAALGSLAAIIAAPDHTVMLHLQDPGPRGLFTHRNEFGGAMALGASLMTGLASYRGRRASDSLPRRHDPGWWLTGAGAALCAGLTIASGSATAQIALLAGGVAAGVGTCMTSLARRARGWLMAASAAVVAGVAALLAATPTLLETVFDRQPHLTGRVPLWELLLSEHIADRPWLGHGLMAFWPHHEVMAWAPSHGHNSFIDIALELGVGASVALATLLAWPLLRALRQQWHFGTCGRPPSSQPLTNTWAIVLVVLGVAALARDPMWHAQQLQLIVLVVAVVTIEPTRWLPCRD